MNIPAPFNVRQMTYLKKTFSSWLNVLEGSKRAGKNVLNTYAFCVALETHEDRFHLIGGVSNATASINVVDCDGYGLLNYFKGRSRIGKYQEKQCVYVQTKVGEKIVFISGGAKMGDEKLIKGFSLGMAYVTEANECHKVFLKEVFDRTIASSNRKIFHDLNPKEPTHWYYKEILEHHEMMQSLDPQYGYNFGHLTIVDNMSIKNARLKKILSTYDKNSLWYKRDILGLRAVADGLVFPYFANDTEKYLFDEQELFNEGVLRKKFDHIYIGVDFGDNGSIYSWTCAGFYDDYTYMFVIDEGSMEKSNTIDAQGFCDSFIKFYKRVLRLWGYVEYVFCDSASNTLINTLRNACEKEGLDGSVIAPVTKNQVNERPRTVDSLLATGRLRIGKNCKGIIKALSNLVWDEKQTDTPKDANDGNINDRWDSFCYTFITHTAYIELER